MRILVLAGGDSAEREVSLQSGSCVTVALRERGHQVTQLDPRDIDVRQLNLADWDAAIPMVHGTGSEDGVLQRDLIQTGIPWVGSSPEASELTFDKIRTNALLHQHGIQVPESVVVTRRQTAVDIAEQIRPLGQSIVTKPPRQGSSIGVSIVSDPAELSLALDLVWKYDDECLIERFIDGREVTVAVVNGEALPSIEIVPVSWYDYESKYQDDRTVYQFENAAQSARHGQIAVRACQVCGVSGIARVDFRVNSNAEPYVLEINTIPGMTTHSLVPMAALKYGLTLGELFERSVAAVLRSG